MKVTPQRISIAVLFLAGSALLVYMVYPQYIIGDVYAPTPELLSQTTDKKSTHTYVDAQQLAEYGTSDLSDQEITDLYYMRQEEKLARDVYRALGKSYDVMQFRNIPTSEQSHTDAIELLIERYDLEDPITNEDLAGIYKDAEFTNLYQSLTTQGAKSLKDALTVGATIEDMNMKKLLEVIENTDNEDISFVYRSILSQSHHHMQAFYRGLQGQGIDYSPTFVSQEYFDQLISNDTKGCLGGNCNEQE